MTLKKTDIRLLTSLFWIVFLAFFLMACSSQRQKNDTSGKPVITVSILPEKTFVEKIAGWDG